MLRRGFLGDYEKEERYAFTEDLAFGGGARAVRDGSRRLRVEQFIVVLVIGIVLCDELGGSDQLVSRRHVDFGRDHVGDRHELGPGRQRRGGQAGPGLGQVQGDAHGRC